MSPLLLGGRDLLQQCAKDQNWNCKRDIDSVGSTVNFIVLMIFLAPFMLVAGLVGIFAGLVVIGAFLSLLVGLLKALVWICKSLHLQIRRLDFRIGSWRPASRCFQSISRRKYERKCQCGTAIHMHPLSSDDGPENFGRIKSYIIGHMKLTTRSDTPQRVVSDMPSTEPQTNVSQDVESSETASCKTLVEQTPDKPQYQKQTTQTWDNELRNAFELELEEGEVGDSNF